MQSGIILLDKAEGISSAKAIAQVKHKLKLKKIGHAGTLDPFATGLLVCLVGRATRLSSYAVEGRKVYSGSIKFGQQTTTDDITGELIKKSDLIPELDVIQAVIRSSYMGKIMQYPPQISAIKVRGMAAYERVRKLGEDVVFQAREVTIEEFDILKYEGACLKFRIACSPGTYIRSIARDLGSDIGCGGCVESLRREASWPFLLENAGKIEDLQESDILDWSVLFPGAAFVGFGEKALQDLSNGDQRPIGKAVALGILHDCQKEGRAVYGDAGSKAAKGLLFCQTGRWKSVVYVG